MSNLMMFLSMLGAKLVTASLSGNDSEIVDECSGCPIEDCPVKDVMVSDYYGDQRIFHPDYPDICELD